MLAQIATTRGSWCGCASRSISMGEVTFVSPMSGYVISWDLPSKNVDARQFIGPFRVVSRGATAPHSNLCLTKYVRDDLLTTWRRAQCLGSMGTQVARASSHLSHPASTCIASIFWNWPPALPHRSLPLSRCPSIDMVRSSTQVLAARLEPLHVAARHLDKALRRLGGAEMLEMQLANKYSTRYTGWAMCRSWVFFPRCTIMSPGLGRRGGGGRAMASGRCLAQASPSSAPLQSAPCCPGGAAQASPRGPKQASFPPRQRMQTYLGGG